MARTRRPATAKGPSQMPTVQTATPLRRSIRSTRALQPLYGDASDDESKVVPEKPAKGTKKLPPQPQEVRTEQSPPSPRYNTRSKQVQSSEESQAALSDEDEEGVEELPVWPRYKDDLPNAFNGKVDPSQDFISKAPVEIIDNILSFLILDHDPDRGVKMKEGNYKARPHVLISMSAMSKLFYHAVEGFAQRFYTNPHNPKHYQAFRKQIQEREKAAEERVSKQRRSSRLASQPKPETVKIYRTELLRTFQNRCAICLNHCWTVGKFANTVSICNDCESSVNGRIMVCQLFLRVSSANY